MRILCWGGVRWGYLQFGQQSDNFGTTVLRQSSWNDFKRICNVAVGPNPKKKKKDQEKKRKYLACHVTEGENAFSK